VRRYCGRDFSTEEQEKIFALIKNNPSWSRAKLAQEVCRLLAWYKADGDLKAMSCRVAMLRMQEDGLFNLPLPRHAKSTASKPSQTHATDPLPLINKPVHQLGELQLRLVTGKDSRLWNEYIERYHYLGYTTLPGAQLRYFVTMNEQVLALLGFGASAWQVAPRDEFIGWEPEQRLRGLPLIVNNARFLILPWIQSKNLASKILAMTARQLPVDWFNRYKIQPVLMETFVESTRFRGICYKAANWIHVGKTKGRGKLGPNGQSVPIKDILLYPLSRNFRSVLKG
jgi:hypothetical protein